MKKIKYPYYNIDCGFFPAQIKLCFNDTDFQRILKDHKIEYRANALDEGCAETHYFSDEKEGLIVLAIDLEATGTDIAVVAGTVASCPRSSPLDEAQSRRTIAVAILVMLPT